MISVVVYGRNDAHWSNLPKRAVLSLNCLAEMLDHADDEIIFVDYNSPDDLPTFIEANADTLTAKARARLRVIRVREADHQPFQRQGSLPVVEAVARNVALRRVNPANPWVLNSNTDVIVLAKSSDVSLSGLVANLEEGLYHLPRFEVPEMLWESAERGQPVAFMGQLKRHGRRLGLDQVVLGYPETVFDYAGDFQLAPRHLLMEIAGFDERMLLRGHCDPDLAARLAARGYPARSLAEHLSVWHCSHHRGFRGGGGRTNNSGTSLGVSADSRPPGQQDSWGLATVELEEIRLCGGAAPFDLDVPVDGGPAAALECPPTPRQALSFRPADTIAYLADLVWNLPRRTRIGMMGHNAAMAAAVRTLLGDLGFVDPLPTFDQISEDCDVVLVDLSLDAEQWGDADLEEMEAAVLPLEAPLRRLLAREAARIAAGAAPRRFIFINLQLAGFRATSQAERPWLSEAVAALCDLAFLPLQSRLAYGFVRGPRSRADGVRSEGEQAAAGLRLLASRLADDAQAEIGPQEWKLPILRLAESLAVGSDMEKLPIGLPQVLLRGRRERASVRLAGELLLPLAADRRPGAVSAAAALSHWDDDGWFRLWAVHYGGAAPGDMFRRSRHGWSGTQILYALHRLDALQATTSVLVFSPFAGRLLAALAQSVGRIDILHWLDAVSPPLGEAPYAEPGYFERTPRRRPLFGGGGDEAAGADIVIATEAAMKVAVAEWLVPAVAELAAMVKPGGLLVLDLPTRLGRGTGCWYVGLDLLASTEGLAALLAESGLELCGPLDLAMDADTLDCYGLHRGDYAQPQLCRDHFGIPTTHAVLVLRKRHEASTAAWGHGQARLLSFGEGLAGYMARWLPLAQGEYELTNEDAASVAIIEVVDAEGRIIAETSASAAGRFRLEEGGWSTVGIRCRDGVPGRLRLDRVEPQSATRRR
ncbi:MAG: hypothetical protein HYU59_06725 [Magnetospirillum gryphiswaldense]|nr:hypothetical protein [Magnetospirillum gryphiswaldense]